MQGDEVYLKVSLGFAFSTNNNSNITGSCLKAICVSGLKFLYPQVFAN